MVMKEKKAYNDWEILFQDFPITFQLVVCHSLKSWKPKALSGGKLIHTKRSMKVWAAPKSRGPQTQSL